MPYSERFDFAARCHDSDYDIGCDDYDRKNADYNFLINMIKDCNNILQVSFAIFYFVMVRIFGLLFFRYC